MRSQKTHRRDQSQPARTSAVSSGASGETAKSLTASRGVTKVISKSNIEGVGNEGVGVTNAASRLSPRRRSQGKTSMQKSHAKKENKDNRTGVELKADGPVKHKGARPGN